MFFFGEKLVHLALKIFRRQEFKQPLDGDAFFETFAPGNVLFFIDRPYERFSDYEELLTILHDEDPQKFLLMHKGTPYYFLAWTAFDLHNYEKALFYMDSAISEDIRKDATLWLEGPAGKFLTLKDTKILVANRAVEKIKDSVNTELDRFNQISGLLNIRFQDFQDKFVKRLLANKQNGTIISAFYVFLLEYEERYKDLNLRSSEQGSLQPFVIHLFKGGQIFESLLKYLYPTMQNGDPVKTLKDIFQSTVGFKSDFTIRVDTGSSSLLDIFSKIIDNRIETAFCTTSKLRNTTGHNLVWDDIFRDPQKYEKFFQQEINALLYITAKKFI